MPASRTRRAVVGSAAAVAIGVTGLAVSAFSPIAAVLAEQATSDPAPSTTEATSDTTAPADPGTPPADPGAPGAPAPGDPAAPGGPDGQGRPHLLDGALDELVEEGVITQEQADAIRERLQENAQEWRDANPPGERPEGPGGPGGHGGRGGHGVLSGAWEAAAEIIGVDAEALRQGLMDGQSIAEIAEAEGVSRQAVIDAIVAEAETHIDDAVESGWLGEEGAERLRGELPEMAGRLVDAKRPR